MSVFYEEIVWIVKEETIEVFYDEDKNGKYGGPDDAVFIGIVSAIVSASQKNTLEPLHRLGPGRAQIAHHQLYGGHAGTSAALAGQEAGAGGLDGSPS